MSDIAPPARVLFLCSGLGIMNRGIESFFRDAFDGLKGAESLQLRLLKGRGQNAAEERTGWNIPRTGRLARFLGALVQRNSYVVEQWSFFPSVVRQIRAFRPAVIFYSDANLGFLLDRLRRRIGVPYRLLFSNGGPVHPPFVRTDFVHQVAPCYYEEALAAGEPDGKHILLPYAINVPPEPQRITAEDLLERRRKLALPPERKIVLSVGWISRTHKRMHYLIEELARLPRPRPFLQLVGALDRGSREVIALGQDRLGSDGFAARSVPYEEVFDYYRAADCFVLASLSEGFGRVYLESLLHGLPVIAHRNPVTEFVLGSQGKLCDLTRPGALAASLSEVMAGQSDPAADDARRQWVRDRFSWEALADRYCQMFRSCALSSPVTFEREQAQALSGAGVLNLNQ